MNRYFTTHHKPTFSDRRGVFDILVQSFWALIVLNRSRKRWKWARLELSKLHSDGTTRVSICLVHIEPEWYRCCPTAYRKEELSNEYNALCLIRRLISITRGERSVSSKIWSTNNEISILAPLVGRLKNKLSIHFSLYGPKTRYRNASLCFAPTSQIYTISHFDYTE